jgi:abhydrolase domain-containing protein 6
MTVQNHSPNARESMQRLTLHHTPISYRQSGSGPPLLLLHGWGASSSYWHYTMSTFADRRTCYAPDLPGYGESPPLEGPASVEHLANLIIAFADALGITQFDLNGHSFGGAVAAHIAAHHPQRVRRLVLTCFGTFGTEMEQFLVSVAYYQMDLTLTMSKPWLMLWQPWMSLWQRCMAAAGCVSPVPQALAQPFFHRLPSDQAMLCEGYTDFVCMDYRTSLEGANSMGNPDLRKVLQSIIVPTLLIGARQDLMIMPTRVEGAAKLVPHARVAWINQCGHIPMIECPQDYHQILQGFLIGELYPEHPFGAI